MIGKGFRQYGLNLTPAYYELGMWRVRHLQNKCCVCQINPTVSLNRPENLGAWLKSFFVKSNQYKALVCTRCHKDMTWLPPTTTLTVLAETSSVATNSTMANRQPYQVLAQSATGYTGYLRAAMIAFKYKEDLSALPILIYALHQLPRPKGCHAANSMIVPMPTTNKRLCKRGFDPVTILTYFLSQHWQIPIWDGMIRVRDTHAQQGLTRIQRLSNLDNAFEIQSIPPVSNLLLFDDVMTTGASLRELASTLLTTDKRLKLSAYTICHAN